MPIDTIGGLTQWYLLTKHFCVSNEPHLFLASVPTLSGHGSLTERSYQFVSIAVIDAIAFLTSRRCVENVAILHQTNTEQFHLVPTPRGGITPKGCVKVAITMLTMPLSQIISHPKRQVGSRDMASPDNGMMNRSPKDVQSVEQQTGLLLENHQ
jgi:hypothetical protein